MKDAAQPLRSGIFDKLLESINIGRFQPGSRLVESRLALEFGVSRTPIREALLHLERVGVVRSELSKGFVVNSLSRQEMQETYPILWTLECLALSLGGPRLHAEIPRLRALNRQFFENCANPAVARSLDSAFHDTLISRCSNLKLLGQILQLRGSMGRYEQFYMQQADLVSISFGHHEEIIDAIERADYPAAMKALETNWRFGTDLLLEQLIGDLAD